MSNSIALCKETDCMDMQTTGDFCRLHYIKNWKKIKTNESKAFNLPVEEYITKVLLKKIKKNNASLVNEIEKMENKDEWKTTKPDYSTGEEEFKDLDEIFINDEDLDDILNDLTYIGN